MSLGALPVPHPSERPQSDGLSESNVGERQIAGSSERSGPVDGFDDLPRQLAAEDHRELQVEALETRARVVGFTRLLQQYLAERETPGTEPQAMIG